MPRCPGAAIVAAATQRRSTTGGIRAGSSAATCVGQRAASRSRNTRITRVRTDPLGPCVGSNGSPEAASSAARCTINGSPNAIAVRSGDSGIAACGPCGAGSTAVSAVNAARYCCARAGGSRVCSASGRSPWSNPSIRCSVMVCRDCHHGMRERATSSSRTGTSVYARAATRSATRLRLRSALSTTSRVGRSSSQRTAPPGASTSANPASKPAPATRIHTCAARRVLPLPPPPVIVRTANPGPSRPVHQPASSATRSSRPANGTTLCSGNSSRCRAAATFNPGGSGR